MTKLTINNQKVEVREGATILEAAQMIGIEIPTLCYDKRLTAASACRLCVVEVKGLENLVSACSYPAREGLVVKTDTQRVQRARKLILELILSNHPLDCMTCEKSGSCDLEKYAYELGISSSPFEGEKTHHGVDASNPFIERDSDKCILCGRCITVCDEVQMASALDFTGRGFKTKISTGLNKPLGESPCVFCGQCIAVCPVGALTEKERKFKGREWELKKVSTVCPYCGCGCNIVLNTKENKIVKVTSKPESVVNQGWLCSKGKFGFQFVHSPDRLTTPLIKKEGKFEKASWDEALDLIVNKFREIKEKYGADSIAGFSSAKCSNEENYLFQKFMRAVIGTNNVDHCARLCHASTVAGLARAFGSGAMTNSIEELRNAHCILITGSNTSETHPIIALQIKAAVKSNGARLIVADPRGIEMTEFAHLWLRHRPGTDVALFNGMMNVILSQGLYDTEFIEERTEGFEELKKVVEKYTPHYVENITGVPSSQIISAARMYAGAKSASIVYAMGITQHTTGTDNVLALANLAMLTANVGKESSGVNPLRGQNNVQGACDLGALPNVFPGYQPVEDEKIRKKFEKAWDVSLSRKNGLTVVEVIHAVEEEKIKAMYIMGENSALSDPNSNRTRKALEKLNFLVVQDIFLTETAKYAHVVLPAACFAEKEGTFTNTERRVQKFNKAFEPPGGANSGRKPRSDFKSPALPLSPPHILPGSTLRPEPSNGAKADWQIICQLAAKFGYQMEYESAAEIMEEIASLTPIYGGITYHRLNEKGLQWPCPNGKHPGTRFLHKGKFSRGLGKFHPTPYKEPAELPDEEYPFILSTGRVLFHWHTGTMTRRVEGLKEVYPEGLVEIHPQDAEKLGLATDELVEVTSRRGRIVAKAKITEKSPPGTVFMSFHFKEAAANLLTIDALDPIAKIPEYKVCAVKVEQCKI